MPSPFLFCNILSNIDLNLDAIFGTKIIRLPAGRP